MTRSLLHLKLIAIAFSASSIATCALADDYQNVGTPREVSFNQFTDIISFGQMIRLPTTQTLDSWSFLVLGGTSGNVSFNVAKWDGYEPLAPVYSQVTHYGGGTTFLTFSKIDATLSGFDFPDFPLYLAYLTVDGVSDPVSRLTLVSSGGSTGGGDEISAGTTAEERIQVANPAIFEDTWTAPTALIGGVVFLASFSSPVPEPDSAALMLVALIVASARARRRRH